jgi:hypothetical protein
MHEELGYVQEKFIYWNNTGNVLIPMKNLWNTKCNKTLLKPK